MPGAQNYDVAWVRLVWVRLVGVGLFVSWLVGTVERRLLSARAARSAAGYLIADRESCVRADGQPFGLPNRDE
jgi:hypothetical protein